MLPLKGRLTRYEGYLPLVIQQRSWTPSLRLVVLLLVSIGLVVTSVVFNVIHAVKASKYWARPLDDYQHL